MAFFIMLRMCYFKFMKRSTENERSMFTTITAAVAGTVVLGFSFLLLPINGFWEGVTFGSGLLLTIIFAITAYEGKKEHCLKHSILYSFGGS